MSTLYDPYRDARHRPPEVTRRYALALTLISVGAASLLVSAVPAAIALVTPPPFEYRSSPWPVGKPAVRPGEVQPVTVTRCASELFDADGRLAYLVTRNLANVDTGTRLVLPTLATDVPAQAPCMTTVSLAHSIPLDTPPGRYRFEFGAQVFGRFRTTTTFGYSEPFTVLPAGGGS